MLTDDSSGMHPTPPNISTDPAVIPTLPYGIPHAQLGITVGRGFWIALQYVIFQIAIAIPLSIVVGILAFGQRTMPGPMTTAVVNLSAAALTLKINYKWGGGTWNDILPMKKIPWFLFIPMALCMLGFFFLLSEVGTALEHILPMPKFVETMMEEAVFSPDTVWVTILVLVVIAPVTEEFLFRGLLLPGMMRLYSVRTSIFATALLFAFIHLNPWQFPVAFVLGILLGWWRVRTGSLVPCLFGHAVFNGMPIVLRACLQKWGASDDVVEPTILQLLYFNLFALVLAGGSIAVIAWLFRRLPPPTPSTPPIAVAAPSNQITH